MEMSLSAISNTHILTVSLAVTAAVLIACAIFAICILKKLKKREDKLLRSDVYAYVPRPKKSVEAAEAPEEPRKKREKAKKASDDRPKRGKKTKRPKYVFVSDVTADADGEAANADGETATSEGETVGDDKGGEARGDEEGDA